MNNERMPVNTALKVIVVFILIFVSAFLFSALIIWWLWNFLAGFFEFKTITYPVALAITAVLTIIGGLFRASSK